MKQAQPRFMWAETDVSPLRKAHKLRTLCCKNIFNHKKKVTGRTSPCFIKTQAIKIAIRRENINHLTPKFGRTR